MTTLADIALSVCLLLGVAIITLYAWRFPWRSTPMGRHLMTFMVVFSALAAGRLWARLVGPLGDEFWGPGFVALAGVLAWRLALLWRA